MRAPLNGAQWRIVMAVARECYGRNGGQKLAQISDRNISTMTDLHIRSVRRELSRLFSAGILARSGDPTHRLYGIQKDYQKWDLKSWSLRSIVDGGADQSVRLGGPVLLIGKKEKQALLQNSSATLGSNS